MEAFHYEHLQFSETSSPFIFHRGCRVDKTYTLPAHWHESIEILYFYEGKCTVGIGSKCIQAIPSDIVCINSGKIHFISSNIRSSYNALIIHPSFIQQCEIPLYKSLLPHIRDQETAQLYRVITREDMSRQPLYRSAQIAAISTLMAHLYRNFSTNEDMTAITEKNKYSLAQNCIDYIRLHYLEDISTIDISNRLGVTVNHLCARFKEATGVTVKKYINTLRCHDAEAMLSSGKYSVMEAGLKCGFDNMAYFAKIYRSIIGVNPSVTAANKKRTELYNKE